MIIYNVTINVEDEAQKEWLEWMKTIHIPEVMSTGIFSSHQIACLLTRQPDETGTTYCIQYFCENLELYERYQKEFAPKLQADTQKMFGGRFVAFRSVMEMV
ncbi:MAG: DUF4286 family protein [Bacteroidia bacterium]